MSNQNNTLIGGVGDDYLDGGSGNDSISGDAGNDTLIGGTGDDTLRGEAGNDSLVGNTGSDLLDGGDGNDTLVGQSDNDTLYGGDGDDLLFSYSTPAGTTHNTLDGGAGYDTAFLAVRHETAGSWTVDSGGMVGPDGRTSTVTNAEHIIAVFTAGDDTVTGNFIDGHYQGHHGNDQLILNYTQSFDGLTVSSVDLTLGSSIWHDVYLSDGSSTEFRVSGFEEFNVRGSNGDDSIRIGNGQSGNNTVYGGVGNDTIDTSLGDEYLDGGSGNDSISGDAGNDTLIGGTGDDTLRGEAGNDSLVGNTGSDLLDGGDGNDTLVGQSDNDTLYGGDGDDLLFSYSTPAGTTHNTLDGGAGYDTAFLAVRHETAGSWTVDSGGMVGPDGRTSTVTNAEHIIAVFTAGDDTVTGNFIDGHYQGHHGNDQLILNYTQSFDGLTVSSVDLTLGSSIWHDVYLSDGSSTEFRVSGFEEFNVRGSNGDDSIRIGNGQSGNNTVYGGVGNDTIDTSLGDEYLDGGSGNDSISGDAGNDTLIGGTGDDTLRGEAGNDSLVGNTGSDLLDGGDGNDTLVGQSDNDTLYGGDGDDLLFSYSTPAGTTHNTLDGGAGYDTAFLAVRHETAGSWTVDSGGMVGPDGRTSTVTNAEHIIAVFTAGDDTVTGNFIDGHYQGHHGNDQLILNYTQSFDGLTVSSVDLTLGSSIWHDVYLSDGSSTEFRVSGFEEFNVRGSNGDDSIRIGNGQSGNNTVYGGAGNDTIDTSLGDEYLDGGSGNDSISGDAGNETLIGGAGDDTLRGETGVDLLNGGDGDDTLEGGAGADSFEFSGSIGNDVILDFSQGDDILYLDNISGWASASDVLSSSFILNGDLVIVSNAGSITLSGLSNSLSESDFILV